MVNHQLWRLGLLTLLVGCGGTKPAKVPSSKRAQAPAPARGPTAPTTLTTTDVAKAPCPSMKTALETFRDGADAGDSVRLLHCSPGRFGADGAWLGVAAIGPDADSQAEVSGRVVTFVANSKGAVIAKAPSRPYSYVQPASAGSVSAIDMNGDGVHEVLQVTDASWQRTTRKLLHVYRRAGAKLMLDLRLIAEQDGDQLAHTCKLTWSWVVRGRAKDLRIVAAAKGANVAALPTTVTDALAPDPNDPAEAQAAYKGTCIRAGVYEYTLEPSGLRVKRVP